MSYKHLKKQFLPYFLVIIFFLSMWVIKELPILLKSDSLLDYLVVANKSAFTYTDTLTLCSMYLPLYLLFQYLLWRENAQVIIRLGSRVRYLWSQAKVLLLSTFLFWLIYFLIDVLPLVWLPSPEWRTFLPLMLIQTGTYYLLSLSLGFLMYWLFQLFPKSHLVVLLAIAVLMIVYFSINHSQNDLFFVINLLIRHYFNNEQAVVPLPTLISLIAATPIIICLRILLIQHEEFWQ